MGNDYTRILELLNKYDEELLWYHGPEKAYQVHKFAKILAKAGQYKKAEDLILKAVNKNWSKKCLKHQKSKLLSGFRLVYPLLGLFSKLLKKLLK